MVFGSLLSQGLLQAYVSFSESFWHARTVEFMHSPIMEFLIWMRVPGDMLIATAAFLLGWLLIRLDLGKTTPHDWTVVDE